MVSIFYYSADVDVDAVVVRSSFVRALAGTGGAGVAFSIVPLAAASGGGASLVAHVYALAQARARALLWHARATKSVVV